MNSNLRFRLRLTPTRHKIGVLQVTSVAATITLLLLSPGCRKKSDALPNLRERILAANTSQYCHPPDACSNPFVVATDNGYEVTAFVGFKLQHAEVPAKDLARYLAALPMDAWPLGPSITISLYDFVQDEHAVQENFSASRQVCGALGLKIEVRPGG